MCMLLSKMGLKVSNLCYFAFFCQGTPGPGVHEPTWHKGQMLSTKGKVDWDYDLLFRNTPWTLPSLLSDFPTCIPSSNISHSFESRVLPAGMWLTLLKCGWNNVSCCFHIEVCSKQRFMLNFCEKVKKICINFNKICKIWHWNNIVILTLIQF